MSEPTKEVLELARKLEPDIGNPMVNAEQEQARTAKRIQALIDAHTASLREELRAAREDSARIDWLDAQGAFKFEGWRPGAVSIRAVIDAGRAASKGGDAV